jgi:hypothetical protein
MRPDRLAFVAAGEWRHQHFRARGNAQMIRPECDQTLHERTLGDDAFGQRGVAFRGGNLHQTASCLPPLLLAQGTAGLRRAEGPKRLGHAGARGHLWRTHERRTAVELSDQPSTRVANAGRFTDARPQAEPVQGAKCCVHHATVCSSRTAADRLSLGRKGRLGGWLGHVRPRCRPRARSATRATLFALWQTLGMEIARTPTSSDRRIQPQRSQDRVLCALCG